MLPSERVLKYIQKRGLTSKFQKQIQLLSTDFRHPSLHAERLEPKALGLYSFRVDQKFRGIFFFVPEENAIKIVDVNDHYEK